MPLYPHSILKKPKTSVDLTQKPVDHIPTSKEPVDVDAYLFDRPTAQPGTIADREHRKWTEQAITLQNNPYSRESIERRLAKGFLPENMSMSNQNIQHEGGFTLGSNDTTMKTSSDDGKEIIITDLPRRIDCGPKSSNVSRYRRDYYVHSSRMENNDVTFSNNLKPRRFKTSDSNGPQGEMIERTKALLMAKLVTDDENSGNSERFIEKFDQVCRLGIDCDEDQSSDSELMIDSLDDQGVQDSGNGSSSEKSSTVSKTLSKVESEIQRFQREIERNALEKSRQQEWERRKVSRVGSSMDSLLSVEDLPLESKVPALPPKGKFVSCGSLLPPALPPKQRLLSASSKRVSISTDEVRVIGIGGFSDDSDDGEDHDSTSTSSSSRQSNPGKYYVPLPPQLEQTTSQDNLGSRRESLSDIPANLPSVKELASKFLSKKSPDPQPRKKRTDSPMVAAMPTMLFKPVNSSFEIHSLTARSVPRQFREGLKKSMPEKSDRNIKFPMTFPSDFVDDNLTLLDDTVKNSSTKKQFIKGSKPASRKLCGDQTDRPSTFPNGISLRSPSPEHVGIPAVTYRMPSRVRSGPKGAVVEEITSDESCVSPAPTRIRHPPHNRRKKPNQN